MRHKNAKYTLNERYFEQIDTEEKAYWLGFITADGCVYKNQITLGLKGADIGHVEKFAAAVGTNKPVKLSTRKLKDKTYWLARITICSKEMTSDLAAKGVKPQKSLIAEAWNGPDNLIKHYWRGVVDGDGWVSEIGSSNRKNLYAVGLCGSISMVRSFSDWIRINLDLHVEPVLKGKIHCVTYGGTFAPQKVAKLLYENSKVYLDRKYKRAIDLLAKEFEPSKFAPRKDVSNDDLVEAYKETSSIKKVGVIFKMDSRCVSKRLKDCGIVLKGRWNNGT